MEIETRHGRALAEIDPVRRPAFLMALTHGAAGGVQTADLLAARDAAAGLGGTVARVVQPYRLRGASAPGPAPRQDAAWLDIIAALRGRYPELPLIQGGRSNGARVACRTARAAQARGVLALAFPLHPPGRPDRSRAAELRAAGTDVLVINGDRDPFGIPDPADASRVLVLPGEAHNLSRAPAAVSEAVRSWLNEVLQVSASARDAAPGGERPGG